MKGMISNVTGAILRDEPDNNSKKLAEIECFDEVEIMFSVLDWTKIRINNQEGYVKSAYISKI